MYDCPTLKKCNINMIVIKMCNIDIIVLKMCNIDMIVFKMCNTYFVCLIPQAFFQSRAYLPC